MKIVLNRNDFTVLVDADQLDDTDTKGDLAKDFEWELDTKEDAPKSTDNDDSDGDDTSDGNDDDSGADGDSCDDNNDDEPNGDAEPVDTTDLDLDGDLDIEDDVDPFAGIGLLVPEEASLSVADAAAEAIAKAAMEMRAHLEATDRTYSEPYAPHPDAAAKDHVVTYDERDDRAISQHAYDAGKVAATSRAIAQQLRRVLTARSQVRTQRDQRRGSLDRRKLGKLNQPGRLQPNRNVFTTAMPGQTSRVAVGILVDQSGSMQSSDRIGKARQAAIALGDALVLLKPLGVKFGVWGFDSHYHGRISPTVDEMMYDRVEPLRAHEYKSLSDDWRKVAPRCGAMMALEDNCDGESIRWAAQQLLAAEDVDRRVLIVLSDGEPACMTAHRDGHRRLQNDTKDAVTEITAMGIETLGIGIQTTAVKGYYPSHVVINNPSELEGVLMAGLKQALGVGIRKAS